jgi:anti-sigma factor RsiW
VNCRKVNNLLSAYMDGELAGVEQIEVQQHLRGCCECYDEYESLLCTKRLLSDLALQEPRPELEQEILTRLMKTGELRSTRFNLRAWWSMLSYPQRLRFSALCAGLSLAALFFSVTSITPAERPELAAANLRPDTILSLSYPPEEAYSGRPSVPMSSYLAAHSAWERAQTGPVIAPAGFALPGEDTRASANGPRP